MKYKIKYDGPNYWWEEKAYILIGRIWLWEGEAIEP